MVYYTGDIHGEPNKILYYVSEYNLTSEDVIVILGDVGDNYFGKELEQNYRNYEKQKEEFMKKSLDEGMQLFNKYFYALWD